MYIQYDESASHRTHRPGQLENPLEEADQPDAEQDRCEAGEDSVEQPQELYRLGSPTRLCHAVYDSEQYQVD